MCKNRVLNSKITLLNRKVQFKGEVSGNEPISIDYIPPYGDNLGYTALELLLLSLSSCVGTLIVTYLRKMSTVINKFEIIAKGIRQNKMPYSFSEIELKVRLESDDLSDGNIRSAVSYVSEHNCPVMYLLKNEDKVKISIVYEIIKYHQ